MEIKLKSPTWKDYLSLTKPKVVLLHLLTAAAAMFLAAGGVPSVSVLAWTLVGGALTAGAANALNCYFDRDIDRTMLRTRNRPLPAGRLEPEQARLFIILIAFAGIFVLERFVGWEAAMLAAGAMIYYAFFYTLWLKRHSTWSTVIGSGAGAFPPLIGWIAVTGRIEATPLLLAVIIALWSPPHFWSLAISRSHEFQQADLIVIPGKHTGQWIVFFSLSLVIVSLFLAKIANLGLFYLAPAIVSGIILLFLAVRLWARENQQASRRLFLFSLFYLLALFGAMLIDRVF